MGSVAVVPLFDDRAVVMTMQDNGPSVAFAMGGGLALCLGNISMQYSLAFVGISLTEVVSASLAVVVGEYLCVLWFLLSFPTFFSEPCPYSCGWNSWRSMQCARIKRVLHQSWLQAAYTFKLWLTVGSWLWGDLAGTSVNYVLDGGMNCAVILFPGVACFLVAVVLGSFCHASNAADITLKLNSKQIVPYRWVLLLSLPLFSFPWVSFSFPSLLTLHHIPSMLFVLLQVPWQQHISSLAKSLKCRLIYLLSLVMDFLIDVLVSLYAL